MLLVAWIDAHLLACPGAGYSPPPPKKKMDRFYCTIVSKTLVEMTNKKHHGAVFSVDVTDNKPSTTLRLYCKIYCLYYVTTDIRISNILNLT